MGDIIELHERVCTLELAVSELQRKLFPERFEEKKKKEEEKKD